MSPPVCLSCRYCRNVHDGRFDCHASDGPWYGLGGPDTYVCSRYVELIPTCNYEDYQ